MTTPDLRSAIRAALEPTCRGEDICDTHAEVMYGDQCEDADRDLRDRIDAALAQPEPLDAATTDPSETAVERGIETSIAEMQADMEPLRLALASLPDRWWMRLTVEPGGRTQALAFQTEFGGAGPISEWRDTPAAALLALAAHLSETPR